MGQWGRKRETAPGAEARRPPQRIEHPLLLDMHLSAHAYQQGARSLMRSAHGSAPRLPPPNGAHQCLRICRWALTGSPQGSADWLSAASCHRRISRTRSPRRVARHSVARVSICAGACGQGRCERRTSRRRVAPLNRREEAPEAQASSRPVVWTAWLRPLPRWSSPSREWTAMATGVLSGSGQKLGSPIPRQ